MTSAKVPQHRRTVYDEYGQPIDWPDYPPQQLPRLVVVRHETYTTRPHRPWRAWLVLAVDVACWLVVIGLFALIGRALAEIAKWLP